MDEKWRPVAWLFITAAVLSAAVVSFDVVARRRQPMAVMNLVWPLTALYAGPLALVAYFWFGRAPARSSAHPSSQEHPARGRPLWQGALLGATHCGAGCMLGDVVVDATLFVLGATTVLGSVLLTSYVFEFVGAFVLGIAFQYFAIVPMRRLSPGRGVLAALKADALSLTGFQIGMYVWMAVVQKVFFARPLEADSPVFWFMMQIGMLAGLLTSFPVNIWLIRRGLKSAM